MARYFSTTLSISRYKDFHTIERAANDVCEKIVLKNPDTFNLKFFDNHSEMIDFIDSLTLLQFENNLYRQNLVDVSFQKKIDRIQLQKFHIKPVVKFLKR